MTGQYFVADSSMQRRIAPRRRSRPIDLVDDVDLGEDLRVLVALAAADVDPVRRRSRWRFLAAIEMTSIAVHDPSAARTVSTGLPPWFERAVVEVERWPELGSP